MDGGEIDSEIDEILAEDSGIESEIEIVELERPDEKDEGASGEDATKDDSSSKPESNGEGIKALRCPICLELPQIVAVASCGHPYCHECIFTALSSARRANRREGECSLCRKRVRYDQVIYMEFKEGSKRAREGTPEEEARKDTKTPPLDAAAEPKDAKRTKVEK